MCKEGNISKSPLHSLVCWQCIGFHDYLGFGQIMKNKKYFKSKSNPNLKNSRNFKSNHLKNVSNPNHFLKKPNPNQIKIQ